MTIFLHQPADPFDPVDPGFDVLNDDYTPTNLDIQDCRSYGGGFTVNEHGEEDGNGWMRQLGTFRSLKSAKAFVLNRLGQHI